MLSYFICISAMGVYAVPAVVADCETPNVRTALFRQIDLVKDCWTDEELALLYARRLVQELIPKKVTCNIPLLLEYIVVVLETAKAVACSAKAHRLLLLAIADGFGGYLQAYGLPQTNAKYYEGGVSYSTARQLHDVQGEFRRVLGTDGGGWTRPVFVRRSSCCSQPFKLRPLDRTVCNNLVLQEQSPQPGCCGGSSAKKQPGPGVPLPFLDDPQQPRAIAVPFKDRSLFSLFSKNSTDILLKYYSVSLTCVGPPNAAAGSDPSYDQRLEGFVVSYHAWLTRTVLPHLHDETWYPGFGGVYTILQEMETRGLITQDISYEDFDDDFTLKQADVCENQSNMWFNMWIVLCAFLLFWIVVCNLCCLLKYCSRNNECDYPCSPTTSSSGAAINSLVAMYCSGKQGVEGLPQKDSD